MYYITNHNDQIIAADESFLRSLEIQDIDDLVKKILLEEISFTKKSSTELQIRTSTATYSYTINHANLSSMLGSLNLIHLEMLEVNTNDKTSFTMPDITKNGSLIEDIIQESDDELVAETLSISDAEEDELLLDDSTDKELFDLKNKEEVSQMKGKELFDLSLPDEIIPSSEISLDDAIMTPKIDDGELFDLTLPEQPSETIDKITLDSEDTNPILISIQEVSENIGISEEDYKTFLNDYIDTAISLEEELQGDDENERLSAMGTLTQLADVLQLPKVNSIIQEIDTAPSDELPHLVESFYQTLSRFTIEEENISTIKTSDEVLLELAETNNITLEDIRQSPTKAGFGKIYLEDVKPIHFDFQLEAAANDLSLPVELIEEFVHDFIEQGHSETKKMLVAYEEGDLDSIQKIGHLLKGASSNLRINALSDTLYDIQFCEDTTKLEGLIERYWAHFLSFEQHIDMITK